jgi:predicted DNA-binding transcriptional regulator YafY
VLRFTYADRNGNCTRRQIEPHGLLVRAPNWYAIAWDRDKDEPRLFRADRARRPFVTSVRFAPRAEDLVTGLCPDARPMRSTRSSVTLSVNRR